MLDVDSYTIAWITTTPIVYEAARMFFDQEHEKPNWLQGYDYDYALGSIGKYNVVMALSSTKKQGSYKIAREIRAIFPNLKAYLLLGLGGGMLSEKHDIRLGDIVVSFTSPRNYHTNRPGRNMWILRGHDIPSAVFFHHAKERAYRKIFTESTGSAAIHAILKATPSLRKNFGRPDPSTDKLFKRSTTKTTQDTPTVVLRLERARKGSVIHYGPIASFKSPKAVVTRDAIATKHLDDEPVGNTYYYPCLAIRGICHYSDNHLYKEWQGYAAMAAAAYAKELTIQLNYSQQKHEEIVSRRVPRVGSWLLQDASFTNWCAPKPMSNVLCCIGRRGTGKTFLTSLVIDLLKEKAAIKKGRVGVSFIYLCSDLYRPGWKELVSSIVQQLLMQLEVTPADLETVFNIKKYNEKDIQFLELQAIFSHAVSGFHDVYICIDALDEIKEPENLLKFFREADPSVHLFFTCTDEIAPIITRHFSTAVKVQIHVRDSDIRLLVLDEIAKRRKEGVEFLDSSLEQEITEKIAGFSRECNAFATVELQEILSAGTKSECRQRLKNGAWLNSEEVMRIQDEAANKEIVSCGQGTDPDTESSVWDASEIESVFSHESLISSESSQSGVYSMAVVEWVTLILSDDELKMLLPSALARLGLERFERNFTRLLKGYSRNLKDESSSDLQLKAAHFVRQYARQTAAKIGRKLIQAGKEPSMRLIQQEVSKSIQINEWLQFQALGQQEALIKRASNDKGVETQQIGSVVLSHDIIDEIESEGSEVGDETPVLGTLDKLKDFMVSSEAFERLRKDFRAWLKLGKKEEDINQAESDNELYEAQFFEAQENHGPAEIQDYEASLNPILDQESIEPQPLRPDEIPGPTNVQDCDVALNPVQAKSQSESYKAQPSKPDVKSRVAETKEYKKITYRPLPDQSQKSQNGCEPESTSADQHEESRRQQQHQHDHESLLNKQTARFTITSIFMSSLSLWLRNIFSPPPTGYQRFYYQCGCGETSYVDIKETSPGGLARFQQRVLHSAANVISRPDNQPNSAAPQYPPQAHLAADASTSQVYTQNTQFTSQASIFRLKDSSNNADVQSSDVQGSSICFRTQDLQFLLLCINTKASTSLHQLEVGSLTNDQYLFQEISRAYQEAREEHEWKLPMMIPSWALRLIQIISRHLPTLPDSLCFMKIPTRLRRALNETKLHRVASGDFVRFRFIPIGEKYCPKWFKPREIPPESWVKDKKYIYEPVPMDDVEFADIPLAHLLKPGPHLDTFWISTFPKKLYEELQPPADSKQCVYAWGIRVNETINWAVVLSGLLGVLITISIAIIPYAIVKSAEGGLALGAFLVAVVTVYLNYVYFSWKEEV